MSDSRHLLKEGLSDAIGFVGGALAAYWIARWLGLDLFAEGYNGGSIGAIVAIGLGGGLGLQAARRWRAASASRD
jgi:hypothetical protein